MLLFNIAKCIFNTKKPTLCAGFCGGPYHPKFLKNLRVIWSTNFQL